MQHRELFEAWCEDPKNGVIIADFAVAGTLAREVLDEPKEVMSHSGHKVPMLLFSSVYIIKSSSNTTRLRSLPCQHSFCMSSCSQDVSCLTCSSKAEPGSQLRLLLMLVCVRQSSQAADQYGVHLTPQQQVLKAISHQDVRVACSLP